MLFTPFFFSFLPVWVRTSQDERGRRVETTHTHTHNRGLCSLACGVTSTALWEGLTSKTTKKPPCIYSSSGGSRAAIWSLFGRLAAFRFGLSQRAWGGRGQGGLHKAKKINKINSTRSLRCTDFYGLFYHPATAIAYSRCAKAVVIRVQQTLPAIVFCFFSPNWLSKHAMNQ